MRSEALQRVDQAVTVVEYLVVDLIRDGLDHPALPSLRKALRALDTASAILDEIDVRS